jgi:ABC-type branched-subunit amino acid transport system ATPase component
LACRDGENHPHELHRRKVPVESGSIIWHEAGAPPRDLLNPPPEQRSGPGIGYVSQDRRIFSS